MTTFRMPEQACPCCAYKLDAASSIWTEDRPTPGDYTVCLKCRAILRWDYAMRIYEANGEELRQLDMETLGKLARIKGAISRMWAEQN